jgi:hypothetical protein
MAPPRSTDLESGGDRGGLGSDAEYDAIISELAEVQGVVNVAESRLVALTVRALEVGVSGGTSLTPAKWLAWRAGIAPGRAAAIVRLARRAGELPRTIEALEAGELTVDQAAEIARWIPARYEASAAQVAPYCTVAQLKKALRWFSDPKPQPEPGSGPDPEAHGSISTGFDEQGYFANIRLPEAAGAVFDQALAAMHDDLRRQARADAPDGTEPEPVYAADALVALAETALQAAEAVRPGTDRYLVHAHLEAGPNGLELMTHLGIPLPDGDRRRILCDVKLRGLVHDGTAVIGAGRVTRTINRRLRRAIEHRDGGCGVPGCDRTHGLEIHHIVHWEDGGLTETWNLIALCRYHHACHHRGTLGIDGNADLPRHQAPGVVFTNAWGRPLDPAGKPHTPTPRTGADHAQRAADAAAGIGIAPHHYQPPTGERLDYSGFHLNPDHPEPPILPPAGSSDNDNDGDDDPPPETTGQRPTTSPPDPNGPAGDAPTDPTRAGPTED